MSSVMTPMLLRMDMSRTPMQFTMVVNTTSPTPRMTAFFAPPGVEYRPASAEVPAISKAVEICGRITW